MVILAFSWMVTDEVCSLTVLNNYRSKPDHVLLLISQEKGSCYFWVTPPVTHQSHYLDQFCFTFIIVSQGFILQLLFLLKFWMPQIFPGCFFFYVAGRKWPVPAIWEPGIQTLTISMGKKWLYLLWRKICLGFSNNKFLEIANVLISKFCHFLEYS